MKRLRALAQALSTALAREGIPGVPAYGVHVPYAYPDSLRPLDEADELPWLAERMAAERARYLDHLDRARGHAALFASWRTADPHDPSRPRFDQQWFSGLDGAMAYAMVHALAPGHVIEVGSGHSTRFLARAIADAGLATRLHSIDPRPRRDIDLLCAHVTRDSVTRVPEASFDVLGAGDILFLDGSHALLPGSDVDYLFTRILPRLAPGVVVHVHDVFLPAGYPRAWSRRAYTEQDALACLLAGGERFAILCPNAWLRRHAAERVTAVQAHLEPGAYESGFWMQVVDV